MTITVTDLVAGPFVATGAAQVIPFGFKVFTPDEVEVYQLLDGVEKPISSSAISVSINRTPSGDIVEGGSVTVTAPSALDGPIYLRANPAVEQEQEWSDTGSRLKNLNEALDRITLLMLRGRLDLASAILEAGDSLGLIGKASKAANGSDFADPAAVLANIGGVSATRLPLLVDDFYLSADGADWGLAFSRAFAAGRTQMRDLTCKASALYTMATNANILPNLSGWTPSLNLNGATVRLTTEAGGFRRRGLKDGEVANAASGSIFNGTIDANNIEGANGVRCIFGSNSGGTVDDVTIINMKKGYGWRRFCYADGGAVVGRPVVSGSISGATDAGTAVRWFGAVDDGDLSYVQPGSPIAAGQARPLPTVNSTQDATGCANLATLRYWSNATGAPINVPATLTSAALTAAGLTSGATTATVNGTVMDAAQAEVFISAQARFPRNVIRPEGAIFRNLFVVGGYYGFFTLGTDGVVFDNVSSRLVVRGIAIEFGAINTFARKVLITENLSSGVLVNYGSTGFDFGDVAIYSTRWAGQALFNVQLGAARGSLKTLITRTADVVAFGEYHVYVGPHCSGFRGSGFDLRGDCIKAWVCVESAWRTTAGPGENFSASTDYAGLTSQPLTDVEITNVTTSPTSTTVAALALCQVNDTTNGEIGLSNVRIRGFSALSTLHVLNLVVREMATATPLVTGVTGCRIQDIEFTTATSFSELSSVMLLPRGRKHFADIKRVSNIDDAVLRPIQNLAIPSITYGNDFILNGASAITNFEDNGSGATGQKCLTGHLVYLRGGGQTVNNNGGTNGIILKGAASTTPTVQQRITLKFDAANDQMLEVGRGF